MPSKWHEKHVLIHPKSARSGVLRGFYERAHNILVNEDKSQEHPEPEETEVIAGPSDEQNKSRDRIIPRLLQGITVQGGSDGLSRIFHRSESVRYTSETDRNTPYLEFEIPRCKRVNKIAFQFRSEEQGPSRRAPGEKSREEVHTWFEVSIQTNKELEAPRHFIHSNANGQGQVEGHTVHWDIETASTELRDWLLELETGVGIGVFPRAAGKGFINHVECITVECFFKE